MNINESPIEVTITTHFVLTIDTTGQYAFAAFAEFLTEFDTMKKHTVKLLMYERHLSLLLSFSRNPIDVNRWTKELNMADIGLCCAVSSI
jgi:hypothetical protein